MRSTRKIVVISLLSMLILASIGPFYLAYARRTYTITVTVNNSDYGVIDPPGAESVFPNQQSVFPNQQASFDITPNDGYHIKSVEVDGNTVIEDVYGTVTFTFTKVKDDHYLDVVFEENVEVSIPGAEISVLVAAPELLPGFEWIQGIAGTAPFFKIEVDYSLSDIDLITVTVHYDDTGLTEDEERSLRLFIGNAVDFNDDKTVNGNDVAMIQAALKSDDPAAMFDVNNDGVVDVLDVNIVKEYANSGIVVNPGNYPAGEFRVPWIDITTEVRPAENLIIGQTWHLSVFGVR
jgi:hypothetical protein